MSQVNVDQKEIEKFSALASRWWDPTGEFKPLHKINPLRTGFIEQQARGLQGRTVVDVGCGGGLLTEALARCGATVTGIDMSHDALEVARLHALESQLPIQYEQRTAEDFAATHAGQFEVVTCLEMLEHVPDPAAVVEACARLAQPGGTLVFSTLNRTWKARLLGVYAAEYVLRWLPQGTHDPARFIRPAELIRAANRAGLQETALTGLHYNPLLDQFSMHNRNVDVNYLLACEKPHA